MLSCVGIVSLTFALNNGKDFNSFSVVSKTAFQRIGSLCDIAKLISFIADFGII